MKKRKRLLSLLTALCMLLTMFPLSGITAFAVDGSLAGSGTADDPYQIADAADLKAFRDLVNGGDEYACAVLTANIVINEDLDQSKFGVDGDGNVTYDGSTEIPAFEQWTPIGNISNTYDGTFDGNGHTVSGIYINSTSNHQGMFGIAGNLGTVKDLGVVNSYIKGYNNVGGIAGMAIGTVEQCYNAGTISGNNFVGGVAGLSSATDLTVTNCYNTGSVSGLDYVGGVAGQIDTKCTLQNSYNAGTVSGKGSVGGVAGYVDQGATLRNSYNIGTVSGKGSVGGVAGHVSKMDFWPDGIVKNCYYLSSSAKTGIGEDQTGAGEATVMTQKQMQSADFVATLNSDQDPAPFRADFNTLGSYYNGGYPILNWQAPFDGGTGTAEDPYLIANADELKAFRDLVNAGYETICARLTADIVLNEDLDQSKFNAEIVEAGSDRYEIEVTYNGSSDIPDFEQWTPIAIYDSENDIYTTYRGTFDGDGHTVSGIYINTSGGQQGLFGNFNGGTIKDLGVINSYICGGYYVGGIVGYSYGTVENCYNTGMVIGDLGIGGIVGVNAFDSIVSNCYNTGTITGIEYVGGLAGRITESYVDDDGLVTNSYNVGTVSGNRYVGGVAGGTQVVNNVANCYYLNTSAPVGVGLGSASATGLTAEQITGPSAVETMNLDGSVWVPGGNTDGWRYGGVSDDDETTGEYSRSLYLPQLSVFAANGNETIDNVRTGLPQVTEQAEDGGTITYYLIYNADQFALFRDIVNGTLTDDTDKAIYTEGAAANARLMADIDLNPGITFNADGTYTDGTTPAQWTPIGTNTTVYAGTFDGNNKSVSGIYINTSERYQGVFGRIGSSGAVRNLSVLNSSVTGVESIGGIAGESNGRIENCTNAASVTASSSHAGGIVGACMSNNAVIANCTNSGNVKGSAYVGGIAGRSYANITECANTGNVEGSSPYGVGGIVGITSSTYSVTVESCYNTGDISSTCKSSAYVGGIVGSFQNANARGTIRNCYNTGNITADAQSGSLAGGLLGGGYGNIYDSFSTGTVTGKTNVGGVGGFVNGTVENAYYLSGSSDTGIGLASAAAVATEITAEQITGSAALTNMNLDSAVWTAGQNTAWQYNGVSQEDETLGVYTGTGYLPQLSVFKDNGNETLSLTKTDLIQQTDDKDGKTYYLIYNAANLKAFRDKVNGGETSANGRLMTDIELNPGYTFHEDGTYTYSGQGDAPGVQNWDPIGNSNRHYSGTFDGNGKTVSGIYINTSSNYQGLFSHVNGGTIENLGVVNSYISAQNWSGGVVGAMEPSGTITNCYNTGTVIGVESVGGVVGTFCGTVTNCYNTGMVSGNSNVGGVAGYANQGSTLQNSYNTGTVSGADQYDCVGGVAGFVDGAAVTNCYNIGTVSGDISGSIAGNVYGGSVTNCYYLEGTADAGIGNGDGNGEAESVTIAQIEDTGENGLLAKLVNGSGSGVWNATLSAVTNWEYGKPAVQPVFIWQQTIENAPVYTVTIPEKATAGGDAVNVTMYAGALRADQQVTVRVAEDNDFNLYYGGDENGESITYNAYVNGGSTALTAGALVLSGGNMQSGGNTASAALTFNASKPKFAGDYTGTITFTVSVENAA